MNVSPTDTMNHSSYYINANTLHSSDIYCILHEFTIHPFDKSEL